MQGEESKGGAARRTRAIAFVALAEALLRREEYAKAVDVCRRGILKYPDLPAGYLALGNALLGVGNHTEAAAQAITILKIAPDHPYALLLLGRSLIQSKRLGLALGFLTRGVRIAPDNQDLKDLLAQVQLEVGNTDGRQVKSDDADHWELLDRTEEEVGADLYFSPPVPFEEDDADQTIECMEDYGSASVDDFDIIGDDDLDDTWQDPGFGAGYFLQSDLDFSTSEVFLGKALDSKESLGSARFEQGEPIGSPPSHPAPAHAADPVVLPTAVHGKKGKSGVHPGRPVGKATRDLPGPAWQAPTSEVQPALPKDTFSPPQHTAKPYTEEESDFPWSDSDATFDLGVKMPVIKREPTPLPRLEPPTIEGVPRRLRKKRQSEQKRVSLPAPPPPNSPPRDDGLDQHHQQPGYLPNPSPSYLKAGNRNHYLDGHHGHLQEECEVKAAAEPGPSHDAPMSFGERLQQVKGKDVQEPKPIAPIPLERPKVSSPRGQRQPLPTALLFAVPVGIMFLILLGFVVVLIFQHGRLTQSVQESLDAALSKMKTGGYRDLLLAEQELQGALALVGPWGAGLDDGASRLMKTMGLEGYRKAKGHVWIALADVETRLVGMGESREPTGTATVGFELVGHSARLAATRIRLMLLSRDYQGAARQAAQERERYPEFDELDFLHAKALYRSGKRSEARKALERIGSAQRGAEFERLWAQIVYADDPQEALLALDRAIAKEPGYRRARVDRSLLALRLQHGGDKRGDGDELGRILEAIITDVSNVSPADRARAALGLAELGRRVNCREMALKGADKARELQVDDHSLVQNVVYTYLAFHRLGQVRELVDPQLRRDPQGAVWRLIMARVALARGDGAAVGRWLDGLSSQVAPTRRDGRAEALSGSQERALVKARALLLQSRPGGAIEELQSQFPQQGNSPVEVLALNGLARVLVGQDIRNSLAALGRLARENPKSSEVWLRWAQASLHLNHLDDAYGAFEKAVQANPHTYKAHAGACLVQMMKGSHQRAKRHCQDAIDANPYNLPTLRLAGQVALSLGENTQAVQYFTQVAEMWPTDKESRFGTVEALVAMGNLDTAADAWREAEDKLGAAICRRHAETLFAEAERALKGNDNLRALSLFRQLTVMFPQRPESWWHVGRLLVLGGDRTGAREALRKYLDLAPKGEFVKEARLWLRK